MYRQVGRQIIYKFEFGRIIQYVMISSYSIYVIKTRCLLLNIINWQIKIDLYCQLVNLFTQYGDDYSIVQSK